MNEYLLFLLIMKDIVTQMAFSRYSAAVDSVEVIFEDFFISFRGFLGCNLADLSLKVGQRFMIVDKDAALEEIPQKKSSGVKSHDLKGQLTSPRHEIM